MSDLGELALKLVLTVVATYALMVAALFVSACVGAVVRFALLSAVLVPPRSMFT